MENPTKMDDLGEPALMEPPMCLDSWRAFNMFLFRPFFRIWQIRMITFDSLSLFFFARFRAMLAGRHVL